MAGAAPIRVSPRLIAVLAVALLGTACTRGPIDTTEDIDGDGDTASPAAEGASAGDLAVTVLQPEVICDGAAREVAEIAGATPGEPLIFSSPLPVDIPSVVADAEGRHRLAWHCDPSEASISWEITAEGHLSGKTATFTINGEATETITAAGELIVDIPNPSVLCDGIGGPFGSLSGAAPNEQVNFSSPESSGIRPGTADAAGSLTLNWTCDANDIGQTWNVVAVGVQSGNQAQFSITGVGPVGDEVEPLAVTMLEEPFVCDGTARDVAQFENFAPDEVVDFSSDESSNLIDGRADGQGALTARWQCVGADVGKQWQLTATGVDSQRSATITITGAAPTGAPAELTITFSENPFQCDGASRIFAVIANLAPNELVDFSSSQTGALRQGEADETGQVPIRWQCGAADIDAIWDVTATGATSGRSIDFRITGAVPADS